MTKPTKVLIHNDQTADLAARLAAAVPDVVISQCNSYAALPDAIADSRPDVVYSVRFDGTPGFPRDALFGPDGPVWVANGGAGTDHFGIWDPDRVTVTNAAGVAADMMAEYVIGAFLHFTLDVAGLQSDKAARHWSFARQVRPLAGATLLIVGLGQTGRAIAKRAQAFGMTVVGTRARPQEMDDVDEVTASTDLALLLPRADFIAICTPLTPQTTSLIDAAALGHAKPGAIIADVSRGGVVDQSALLVALQSGKIAGAALDVFETEPLPQDHPLWDQSNVVISPHCASVYDGWEDASFDLFLKNFDHWLQGRPLINIVDPARGY